MKIEIKLSKQKSNKTVGCDKYVYYSHVYYTLENAKEHLLFSEAVKQHSEYDTEFDECVNELKKDLGTSHIWEQFYKYEGLKVIHRINVDGLGGLKDRRMRGCKIIISRVQKLYDDEFKRFNEISKKAE
jgi:hypothetical protein